MTTGNMEITQHRVFTVQEGGARVYSWASEGDWLPGLPAREEVENLARAYDLDVRVEARTVTTTEARPVAISDLPGRCP